MLENRAQNTNLVSFYFWCWSLTSGPHPCEPSCISSIFISGTEILDKTKQETTKEKNGFILSRGFSVHTSLAPCAWAGCLRCRRIEQRPFISWQTRSRDGLEITYFQTLTPCALVLPARPDLLNLSFQNLRKHHHQLGTRHSNMSL